MHSQIWKFYILCESKKRFETLIANFENAYHCWECLFDLCRCKTQTEQYYKQCPLHIIVTGQLMLSLKNFQLIYRMNILIQKYFQLVGVFEISYF